MGVRVYAWMCVCVCACGGAPVCVCMHGRVCACTHPHGRPPSQATRPSSPGYRLSSSVCVSQRRKHSCRASASASAAAAAAAVAAAARGAAAARWRMARTAAAWRARSFSQTALLLWRPSAPALVLQGPQRSVWRAGAGQGDHYTMHQACQTHRVTSPHITSHMNPSIHAASETERISMVATAARQQHHSASEKGLVLESRHRPHTRTAAEATTRCAPAHTLHPAGLHPGHP
jgi:hypothetical protein